MRYLKYYDVESWKQSEGIIISSAVGECIEYGGDRDSAFQESIRYQFQVDGKVKTGKTVLKWWRQCADRNAINKRVREFRKGKKVIVHYEGEHSAVVFSIYNELIKFLISLTLLVLLLGKGYFLISSKESTE